MPSSLRKYKVSKALTPGSLTREEYKEFGPVIKFHRQYEVGWQAALGAVRRRRQ